MSIAFAARSGDFGAVEDKRFVIRDFRLQNGAVMPEAAIAYETYGRLAPDGRNAVLITHGYTSSHHAAGRNPANGDQPGWWDGLIGPGKAIDTDKVFVVASNMLGSSYGSTNGASPDPRTGNPYGPDFPAITVRDIVAAQKALLDSLGVRHLVAVAGPSYGGYQAFQWAVAYPDMMDAVVAVVTAPRSQNAEKSLAELQARLATDPEWHGGRYYGKGGAKTVLTQMRFETLMRYGYNEQLAPRYPDQAGRERAIRQLAADWARGLGRELAGDPAPRHDRLRHGQGFRQDPRQTALRAVPQRRAVSAEPCTRGDEGPGRGRGRGPQFRDRQRSRPFGERPRARQMVAGAARLSRPAGRQTHLRPINAAATRHRCSRVDMGANSAFLYSGYVAVCSY